MHSMAVAPGRSRAARLAAALFRSATQLSPPKFDSTPSKVHADLTAMTADGAAARQALDRYSNLVSAGSGIAGRDGTLYRSVESQWAAYQKTMAALSQLATDQSAAGQARQDLIFYVSKDGQKIVQGNVYDVKTNPFKEDLDKLKTELQPAMGKALDA